MALCEAGMDFYYYICDGRVAQKEERVSQTCKVPGSSPGPLMQFDKFH